MVRLIGKIWKNDDQPMGLVDDVAEVFDGIHISSPQSSLVA